MRNEPKFQPPIRLVVALMKMDPGMLNDCFSFQNDFYFSMMPTALFYEIHHTYSVNKNKN